MVIGTVFFGAFVLVQWPFATFLMTPLARNWVFGTTYVDFSTPPNSLYIGNTFVDDDGGLLRFLLGMLIAAVLSVVTSWVGLRGGAALCKVKR